MYNTVIVNEDNKIQQDKLFICYSYYQIEF